MKSLFNFYLEDSDKKQAMDKLSGICPNGKGLLASYLRVCVKELITRGIPTGYAEKISEEYITATYQSKRGETIRYESKL